MASFAVCGVVSADTNGRLLTGTRVVQPQVGENHVSHRCLTPHLEQAPGQLPRAERWSLPSSLMADTTIRCLVLRFNFTEELPDDPNTTGRGVMDLRRPLDTPADSAAYFDSAGHWIDPPPHDSNYFDAHMRALRQYWHTVSEGRIDLAWDIYPPSGTGTYQLPRPMSYYGRCDFAEVVDGLTDYFLDCIHLADSAHLTISGHPDIDFSQYDAIFLFHAGADRQNDIGFPETCNDLFTGFIRFFGWVQVDNGADSVNTALMMPEGASQDNRATALNAVLAHEFGHQLGLPDIYSTRTFLSQLGDFELMDNNGFGTGIDFGFPVGNVFGAIPVYPSAWCRAFLGLTPVVDFHQGVDLRIVSSSIVSSGIKIARLPISESEYYLLENRTENPSGNAAAVLADSASGVILGPVDLATREPNGEYDFLAPGSGLAIYYVDEGIAALDYDGDGSNNFDDNQLQLFIPGQNRKFLSLIEADGLVNFGGNYRSGFGRPEDLFREDRNRSFTSTSNPPSLTNTGAFSRIAVTDIRRDTVALPRLTPLDTVIRFSVATDGLAANFPVRVGEPLFGLSPISADIDNDGSEEIIVASDKNLCVIEQAGRSLLNKLDSCLSCPPFLDTIDSHLGTGNFLDPPRTAVVPVYYRTPNFISANPVVGSYGSSGQWLIAVAHPLADSSVQINGRVLLLTLADSDNNGMADSVGNPIPTDGWPVAMTFGDALWILTDRGFVYRIASPTSFQLAATLDEPEQFGLARIGSRVVALTGDSASTVVRVLGASGSPASVTLTGRYSLGPVILDSDYDEAPELCLFSPSGAGILLRIDTSQTVPVISEQASRIDCADSLTSNPIVLEIDNDGYADIVVAGVNRLYAFNRQFVLVHDFPLTIDNRFPDDAITATPIAADIDSRTIGDAELLAASASGNLYSFAQAPTIGFPIKHGSTRETAVGSSPAYVTNNQSTSFLAVHGGDGWLYLWQTDFSFSRHYWPMYGSDPGGSFAIDPDVIGPLKFGGIGLLPPEQFFAYENPVVDGSTRIRYRLEESASSVVITIHDFSGEEVARLVGPTGGGIDQELVFDCSTLTPGVYRAVLVATVNGSDQTRTTDIAVLR